MPGDMSRRDFVKGAVIAASAAALGVGALSTFIPALSDPRPVPTPIVRRLEDGVFDLTLDELDGPPIRHAVGEWKFLPAILFKVPRRTLEAAARHRGYNTGQYALQHPGEPDNVVLAYDARCTHMGCTVGFNATLGASKDVNDYDGDGVADGRIMCPCHQAQFDVFDLALNVPGTPAPRPLEVLEISFGPRRGDSPTILASRRIRQGSYRGADAQGDGASFRLAG